MSSKQEEANEAGEDLLGSRWLRESFSSLRGDEERREGGWRKEILMRNEEKESKILSALLLNGSVTEG